MSRPSLAEIIGRPAAPPARVTLAGARERTAAHERETARCRARMTEANEKLEQARADYARWLDETDENHRQWVARMTIRLEHIKRGNQS